MRVILPLTLLLAGCSDNNATNYAGTYGAGPRDRVCIESEGGDALRVGLIAYGQGSANCSIKGTGTYIEGTDGPLMSVHPTGDSQCEFHVDLDEPSLRFRPNGPACAYYCGPDASLDGKSFTRLPTVEPVADLAGDPLC